MKVITFVKEEKLISEAMNALMDRLGPVETNRFLSPLKTERVESVKRP